MKPLPASHVDILDGKAFVHLATVMPDGTPQCSPVWVDRDGDVIVVNSAAGRRKDRNMRKNAHVALSVSDPANPYRCLMIRGRVVEITSEGAEAHIDKLAKKYMGVDRYPFRTPTEVRVIYRIEADHVAVMG